MQFISPIQVIHFSSSLPIFSTVYFSFLFVIPSSLSFLPFVLFQTFSSLFFFLMFFCPSFLPSLHHFLPLFLVSFCPCNILFLSLFFPFLIPSFCPCFLSAHLKPSVLPYLLSSFPSSVVLPSYLLLSFFQPPYIFQHRTTSYEFIVSFSILYLI